MREPIEADENWVEFQLDRGPVTARQRPADRAEPDRFRDHGARRHLMRFGNGDEGTPDLDGSRAVL